MEEIGKRQDMLGDEEEVAPPPPSSTATESDIEPFTIIFQSGSQT